MTDPSRCSHTNTVPVEAGGAVVASLCVDCSVQLHAGWACDACEWETTELRRLGDAQAEAVRVLTRPCPTHEGD